MKNKSPLPPAGPPTPAKRDETERQRITELLDRGGPDTPDIPNIDDQRPLTARELSALAGVAEKEVYSHLEHIQKTSIRGGKRLVVTPAECRHCAFVFKKRRRLTRPGRCPLCRSESIEEPLFSIQ